ncbi:MAG: CBS domain-containing protein [Methanomassiliicoccales archaeon]|nr:CBS domain-containing protein [Methanomassiliicoccales archaeon]
MVTKKSMRDALVEDAMSRRVVSVVPQTSLKELMAIFEEQDFNMLPVIKDGNLVGVVTKLDLLRAFVVGRTFTKTNSLTILADEVEDIMSTAVESVAPGDTIRQAVEAMVENRLRSMPVVDGENLVGIISRGDVMRYLVFE